MKLYLKLVFVLALIFINFLKAQLGKEYRDTLLAGVSQNQVQVVFVDTFNTNSLDLTGSPRDLTKWTKSNQSGSPSNPTINTTTAWYTVGSFSNRGYEWGSTAFLRQALTNNQGVYLWTPQINFPDVDNLYLKFILRCSGFNHSLTNNFTIGWVFDGNNDQVPDATPTGFITQFQATPVLIDPYNDYTSGNFFPNTMMNARTVNMDITALRNRTGRIGIRLSQNASTTNNFDIDWVVVGTRPNNDLCANAIQLKEGYNGGARGFYNSLATGLTPCSNSSPGNRQGGAVIYVGNTPNGIGAIPTDGTFKDGYEPNNPGPFGSTSRTVENSLWFKFVTPMASQCASGNLAVRITPRDLSCACNSAPTPRQLQVRIFNNAVCGTNTPHGTVAITAAFDLNNNSPIVTGTLSYNTTYYVLVDGVNAADCQFRLQVETLLDGVVQTIPCVVQNPTLLPIDFHTLKVKCNSQNHQAELSWNINEAPVSPFLIEHSKNGDEWKIYAEIPNHQNSTFIPAQNAIYRVSYIADNGEVKYSNVAECNCENILNTIQIYPSPFLEEFTINNLPIDAQIKIYDIKGNIVHETISKNFQEIISLKNSTNEIYLVNIFYNGEMKSMKIMKTQ